MTDASMFDFSAMTQAIGSDPFATQANKFARDERFYTLTKDKETGQGAAIIRFLPDSENGMIQSMYKINTTIVKNGKKRFVSEFSPSTIGQPCPFQEEWARLWNEGDKDGAKLYGRNQRFITNIKVLKDPKNPENEGKIFLFDMSASMKDKIQQALNPSEDDIALGAEPKQLFNPIRGNSFKLATKKGANGIISYDPSDVIPDVNGIYDTPEEALADIKANTYKLSDLHKPESFMSYDELVKKKAWVNFAEVETVAQPLTAEVAEVATVTAEVQPSAPTEAAVVEETKPVETKSVAKEAESLDDMLNDLL